MQQKHHAFSMVELAVVIAIIALLVGGIASLRNYTKNAELNTLINESKILVNAFSQFQTRYGAPPGDFCSVVSPTACGTQAAATTNTIWPTAPDNASNGDGNGLIRTNTTCAGGTAADCFTNERYYAFRHLALAGFIQGTYTGAGDTSGTGATIGKNVVGASIPNVAFIFDHPDAIDGFATAGDGLYFESGTAGAYGNTLIIAGLNANASGIPDQPFLSPKDAFVLDRKFDDGAPGRGTIMTPDNTARPNCANSDDASTAVYDVTTAPDAISCYLIVRMQ